MLFTFKKQEKLKRKKLITLLFNNGKRISVYPIMLLYLENNASQECQIQTAVTVSKKNFKNAVDRNKIKRMLRESYRLNKNVLYNVIGDKKYIFMFIYLNKEKPVYQNLNNKMKILIEKFKENS